MLKFNVFVHLLVFKIIDSGRWQLTGFGEVDRRRDKSRFFKIKDKKNFKNIK
jgi:hypothetical protein